MDTFGLLFPGLWKTLTSPSLVVHNTSTRDHLFDYYLRLNGTSGALERGPQRDGKAHLPHELLHVAEEYVGLSYHG